jgi:hypothetical protein
MGRHSADSAPEPPAQWSVDIVGFLLARIGEDEALVAQVEADRRSELAITTMGLSEDFGIYISTLRLAAECESKRAVVLHRTKGTQQFADVDTAARINNNDTILRMMARVYAEHPDFNPVWGDSPPGQQRY